MLICIFTGFSSGLPLYILISLLPARLRSEGVNLKAIGLFALINLPFTFTYNGNAFSQMSMSCNGWVGCGNQSAIDATNSRTGGNLFTSSIPNNTLAPWFKDMGANFPLGSGSMRHGLVGTDVYAFQWNNAVGSGFTDGSAITISFQVNIYGPASTNPGRIDLLYGPSSVTIAGAAAIGIEDAFGGSGHFINALNGSATLITTTGIWPGSGNGYSLVPCKEPRYLTIRRRRVDV